MELDFKPIEKVAYKEGCIRKNELKKNNKLKK